ncbi:MAG: hypothetical protein ACR2J4_05870 [Deinococcus sp.]
MKTFSPPSSSLHRSVLGRLALALLGVLLLSLPASALQLVIWDPQLQTKLGYGELSGGKLSLQIVGDYSGPVVALFTREPGEANLYPGLDSRYDGQLQSGQLNLGAGAGLGSVPLARLLSSYKLTLDVQNAARSFTLPGLKASPGGNGGSGGNSNPPGNSPGKPPDKPVDKPADKPDKPADKSDKPDKSSDKSGCHGKDCAGKKK